MQGLWSTSYVPHISLMECIASCGAPTSIVRQPRLLARMGPENHHSKSCCAYPTADTASVLGTKSASSVALWQQRDRQRRRRQGNCCTPIVDPQAMSLRTANS